MRRIVILLGLILSLILIPSNSPSTSAAEPSRPVFAYYYGWWGSQTWYLDKIRDRPLELYESDRDSTMLNHIRQAKNAGIDGFICTWRYTCARLLQLAEQEGNFNVVFSVDPVADGTLNSTQAIVDNMREMAGLASSNAYWRWDGKPVFVFWNDTILPGGRGSLSDWTDLRSRVDPNRNQFWLGGGVNFSLLDVFDAIHFFDITWERKQGDAMSSYSRNLREYNSSRNSNKPFVATVMPGYDDLLYRNGHFRDRENGNYYRAGWDTAINYQPKAIILTSWNEWYEGSQLEPSQGYGNLYLDISREKISAFKNNVPPIPDGFADANFEKTWQRTDKPVQDGRTSRSWVWGPAIAKGQYEPYGGSTRLVQYFDKSRMEVNNPNGDRSQPWFVTNGLLVVEMIRGQVQIGDSSFEQRIPADEALGGDPRAINDVAPGYSSLRNVLTNQSDKTGQTISTQLKRDATTSGITAPSVVTNAHYVSQTQHNIPDVFWNFMNQTGTVYENGRFVNDKQVVDWVFAFGYPLSDAYWMRAKLGGTETWMLVQAFERRILTYTPTNAPAFQVEMGNVGQHYRRWRYGN